MIKWVKKNYKRILAFCGAFALVLCFALMPFQSSSKVEKGVKNAEPTVDSYTLTLPIITLDIPMQMVNSSNVPFVSVAKSEVNVSISFKPSVDAQGNDTTTYSTTLKLYNFVNYNGSAYYINNGVSSSAYSLPTLSTNNEMGYSPISVSYSEDNLLIGDDFANYNFTAVGSYSYDNTPLTWEGTVRTITSRFNGVPLTNYNYTYDSNNGFVFNNSLTQDLTKNYYFLYGSSFFGLYDQSLNLNNVDRIVIYRTYYSKPLIFAPIGSQTHNNYINGITSIQMLGGSSSYMFYFATFEEMPLQISGYSSSYAITTAQQLVYSADNDNELNGYGNGYDIGYNTGYSDGEKSGYDTGYDTGLEVGYSNGYSQGTLQNNSFLSLFSAVVDAPISVLTSWLDFEILGYNLSGFITSLLSIAIIITVVRFFV